MSAIIAGKVCKQCGPKEWFVSLGHPKWYDDVVKRGKEKGVAFKVFEHIRYSGLCPECFLVALATDIEKNPEKYSDEFVATAAAALGVL